MIQKYEVYTYVDEDDDGKKVIEMSSVKNDKGDWCKAEDAEALEAENKRLRKEIDLLQKAVSYHQSFKRVGD